jgi:hypothetical protein
MHGNKFLVMGGKRVTSDNMFKAAEIDRWPAEAAEVEKGKKSYMEYHLRREAALPILERLVNELENNVRRLTNKGLETLLRWKSVPVSKMGNVVNKRNLYQQFAEGGAEEVSIPALWRENNQIELNELRNVPIKMADTLYGRFLVQQKRNMEWNYQKMSTKEKNDYKQKMAKINKGGVDEGQFPPPRLTPI